MRWKLGLGVLGPGVLGPGVLGPGVLGLAVIAAACERRDPYDPSTQPPSYDRYGNPTPQYAPPGQPGYPQPGYPQPGYPQPGYPQPGYPQPGYPQPGYPQPGYPQPGAPQPTSTPAALALPCSNDSTCGTHRCNMQVGRCSMPCAGPADCLSGMACVYGACLPGAAPR